MRRARVFAIVIGLMIAATAVSIALAAAGGQRAKPNAKPAPASAVTPTRHVTKKASATTIKTMRHVTTKASAAKTTRSARVKTKAAPAGLRAGTKAAEDDGGENTATDPDNVQQGDQSGADDAVEGGESESTPGDASVDHVEQPAGAEHECPPDCAPGEQP